MFEVARPLTGSFEKPLTKKDLLKELEEYKGILNKAMIDYLTSLVNLEFSVVRNYISETDRKALAKLDIYKQIATYNICKRIRKLFSAQKDKYKVSRGNANDLMDLYFEVVAKLGTGSTEVFSFFRHEDFSKLLEGYTSLNIGTISLYQTLESKELRKAELEELRQRLEGLKRTQNPYPDNKKEASDWIKGRGGKFSQAELRQIEATYVRIGGPGANWIFEHDRDIAECERKFKELSERIELTDEQKRTIELTAISHELILEEFGLKKEDFEEYNEFKFSVLNEDKPNMSRKLVKEMPNLLIEDNITYL